MISLRWAVAFTLSAAVVGCQPVKKPAEVTPAPVTADAIADAKAKYAAQGALVGEVDGVNEVYAAVTGIDPKALTPTDVISFIDVESRKVVSHGTLHDTTVSGRLVIDYDKSGDRAPKKGDLAVKLK